MRPNMVETRLALGGLDRLGDVNVGESALIGRSNAVRRTSWRHGFHVDAFRNPILLSLTGPVSRRWRHTTRQGLRSI